MCSCICFCTRFLSEIGYIDMSKRRVAPEEIAKCDQRWNKSKSVDSIMRRVAKTGVMWYFVEGGGVL